MRESSGLSTMHSYLPRTCQTTVSRAHLGVDDEEEIGKRMVRREYVDSDDDTLRPIHFRPTSLHNEDDERTLDRAYEEIDNVL